jgi:capsular polysaccharide biosynthesis protein
MPGKVTVPLPLNIDREADPYFSPYTNYVIPPLRARNWKNVFVTYSGLAINRSGLIKECYHDYPEQHRIQLNEAAYYFHEAEKDADKLIELDDDRTYLLIHHPWCNYYHWICEAILRLWIVKDKIEELVLLLPETYKDIDFVMGSLEPFCVKDVYFIPKGKSVLIKNLCLPAIKPQCDSYDYEKLTEIRKLYLDYLHSGKIRDIDLGERIYLSRKKAGRKKVLNEEEVENIMRKYGFAIVNNEDFTFLEQVGIYSHARYLVSIHGSGLTNMLFMQGGSSILEILKHKTNTLNRPSFVFWYQAAALGFKYYQQLNPPVNKDGDDYFFGDFHIDEALLGKNVTKMLREGA